MKKRLFALLVATLIVLGVAIPLGAEENVSTYKLVAEGTIVAIPSGATPGFTILGTNNDAIRLSWNYGYIAGYTNWDGIPPTERNIAIMTLVDTVDGIKYYQLTEVADDFRITINYSRIDIQSISNEEAFFNCFVEVTDPEPEVTDPEPEVTDPEPEVTDPEPEVTDPEPEVTDPESEDTDDGLTESTANALRFWEEFFNKILQYIAHPSYALYDINSPAFTVLVLVFAGAFLLLVLDFIKQFFTNFRR